MFFTLKKYVFLVSFQICYQIFSFFPKSQTVNLFVLGKNSKFENKNPPRTHPMQDRGRSPPNQSFSCTRPDYPNLSIRAVEKLVTELDSHAESQFSLVSEPDSYHRTSGFENRTRNSLSSQMINHLEDFFPWQIP